VTTPVTNREPWALESFDLIFLARQAIPAGRSSYLGEAIAFAEASQRRNRREGS
jgi:hypothetical protein